MKSTLKVLSLSLISVFVLSACNNSNEATADLTEKGAVDQSISDPSLPDVDLATERYDENLDCNDLQNGKDECEKMLNEVVGGMLESEVLSMFDYNRCSKLGGSAAESCKKHLMEAGVKGPVTEEELTKYNEILAGEMVESNQMPSVNYNISACGELKTVGFKEYCENQVTQLVNRNKFEEILQSGNAKNCDLVTDKALQTECKTILSEQL